MLCSRWHVNARAFSRLPNFKRFCDRHGGITRNYISFSFTCGRNSTLDIKFSPARECHVGNAKEDFGEGLKSWPPFFASARRWRRNVNKDLMEIKSSAGCSSRWTHSHLGARNLGTLTDSSHSLLWPKHTEKAPLPPLGIHFHPSFSDLHPRAIWAKNLKQSTSLQTKTKGLLILHWNSAWNKHLTLLN
jgi:hypothetical protein